jgi:hypothetical protein
LLHAGRYVLLDLVGTIGQVDHPWLMRRRGMNPDLPE